MLGVLSRPLPDTATYTGRGYHLVAPAVADGGLRHTARVTISQRPHRKTARGAATSDTYFVDEVPATGYPPGFRSFLFLRQTGAHTEKAPGLYEVLVDPAGKVLRCSCTGAVTQRQDGPCKHRDTIQDVLDVLSGKILVPEF